MVRIGTFKKTPASLLVATLAAFMLLSGLAIG